MSNPNKGKNFLAVFLCIALLLVVLLFAGDTLSSGGYIWPVLIGICVLMHIVMMFRGHGSHGGNDASGSNENKGDEKGHGGCCR